MTLPFDDNPTNNPAPLSRFQPGNIPGASDGTDEGINVWITTNLAGEPVRFSMQENADNIVASGSITMLNAIIGDGGNQIDGIMGEVPTEEDQARYGTIVSAAPIEPNALVTVSAVVSVTSYTDEEDVPYYEVTLEGMGQAVIDCKFDAKKAGSQTSEVAFMTQEYYDKFKMDQFLDADKDGYISGESEENAASEVKVIGGAEDYLAPFLSQLAEACPDFDFGVGSLPGMQINLIPVYRVFKTGESCWQIIEDIIGLQGIGAMFTRDGKMVISGGSSVTGEEGTSDYWTLPPSGKNEDGSYIYPDGADSPIPDANVSFGQGLQLSYSKAGVCNWCSVTGVIAVKNEDGDWVAGIGASSEISQEVFSQAADNILNGAKVGMASTIPFEYYLQDASSLEAWGQKELAKTIVSAKGVSYESSTIPFDVAIGGNVYGSSKIGGSTTASVNSYSLTVDVQAKTISTSFSGTRGAKLGTNIGTATSTDSSGWN
jgi:hypothetical protein